MTDDEQIAKDVATTGQGIVRVSADKDGAVIVTRIDPRDIYMEPEKDEAEQTAKVLIWASIFGSALVIAILAYELKPESDPIEMVEWSQSERCLIIHGKPCGEGL